MPESRSELTAAIHLAIAALFYVAAWTTKNPDFVAVANLAMIVVAAAFILSLIDAFRKP